jgi:hypothetical protein
MNIEAIEESEESCFSRAYCAMAFAVADIIALVKIPG